MQITKHKVRYLHEQHLVMLNMHNVSSTGGQRNEGIVYPLWQTVSDMMLHVHYNLIDAPPDMLQMKLLNGKKMFVQMWIPAYCEMVMQSLEK